VVSSRNNCERTHRRVVVTGIGLVTPFGIGREASWRGLLSGESATRRIGDGLGSPAAHFTESEAGEPVVDLAVMTAEEAVVDAGLNLTEKDRERVGCVIGTSKPALRSFAKLFDPAHDENQARFEENQAMFEPWHDVFPHAASLAVSHKLGLTGPCLCPVAACATGLVCLQRGYELIRHGHCEVVLAGSSDASLLPIVHASFKRLGVLARDADNASAACRPFDRNRSGFVIGEGAAVLVLERLDDAQARGANIYGEWLGGAIGSDGSELTGLEAGGESLARLIADLLQRGGVDVAEIDYVNLHGTATLQNDVYETRALKSALGRHADRVKCSSLKGGIGHLLGAAGSVETAATLLAMRDGVVPPTVNLEFADPECDLDYTPRKACRTEIRTVLKLSLGFGGHLAAAILRGV